MNPMRVMTFNIRYGEADDGADSWQFRRDLVFETIRDRAPDLLALQEPTGKQWEELVPALPDYTGIFGEAHDKGPFPHGVGVFFRSDRFDLAGQRVFWQSDTPDVPGSVSFPNHWGPRPTVVALLRDRKDGRELAFAGTHVDTHPDGWLPSVQANARELDRTAGGRPSMLLGDFNTCAGSESWRFLTGEGGFRDAWTEAGLPDEAVATFHAFTGMERLPVERPAELEAWLVKESSQFEGYARIPAHVMNHRNYRIDWVMTKGPWKALSASLDQRKRAGRCASDHWAVIADLELLPEK